MADADTGVNNMFQGMMAGNADWERTFANGKIADSIVKTNPEMLDAMGMDPNQFASMSAPAKTATVTGYFQAQGAKQQAAKTAAMLQDYASQAQERSSVANWRTAQANRQTQQDQEDTTTGDFLRNVYAAPATSGPASYPGGANDPTAQMMTYGGDANATGGGASDPNARIAWALQNTPGVGGKSFLNAYKTLMQYGGPAGTGTTPVTTPGPYPGVSLVTDPRGGGVHVVTDPSMAVQPLVDADGNPVPGGYQTRNGVRFAPPVKPPDESLVTSRNQAALTSWHKRLDPVQTQLEYAQSKVSDPNAAPGDIKKYTPMVQTLTKQRDQILAERPSAATLAPKPTIKSTSATPAIPKPTSQEEFDALPSGAQFVNPADGRVLTKK